MGTDTVFNPATGDYHPAAGDQFGSYATSRFPPNEAVVAPSDSADDNFEPSMIQVLTGGTISYVTAGGQTLTRTLEDKEWIYALVVRVNASGTTADDIRRHW